MVKHSGLGKGLDALIPGNGSENGFPGITTIATQRIKPNPRQPRSIFRQEELKELAESIRENGIIQPLIISPAEDPGDYYLDRRRKTPDGCQIDRYGRCSSHHSRCK